jgi:hypothetical protein
MESSAAVATPFPTLPWGGASVRVLIDTGSSGPALLSRYLLHLAPFSRTNPVNPSHDLYADSYRRWPTWPLSSRLVFILIPCYGLERFTLSPQATQIMITFTW